MANAAIEQSPTITLTLNLQETKALLFLINEHFKEVEWDDERMLDELVEISGALEALPLRLSNYSWGEQGEHRE
tara:strand:- start:45 stop:266 length:222 start_codon:yes stop_codon:yes gene_type:complete